MKAFRMIVGAVIGLLFGIGAGMLAIPAAAAFVHTESQASLWIVWLVIIAGLLLGLFAPTIRRAFGRGFLLVGAGFLALPLSMLLLSGRVAGDMVAGAQGGAEQVGAAIGSGLAGAMMTGAASFIGFFAGMICVVIGLVLCLGGRREVVVVDRPATGPADFQL